MIGKGSTEVLQAVESRIGLLDAGCFSFGSAAEEQWIGFGTHPESDDVTCVFTLGNLGAAVFFTMTDGDKRHVGGMLAAIEQYGSLDGHDLKISDSMPMSDPYALDRGRVAAMLMTSDLFPGGAALSSGINAGGHYFSVMSVIFLDAAEYSLRRTDGAVGLIECFERDGRDCITFDAGSQSTSVKH